MMPRLAPDVPSSRLRLVAEVVAPPAPTRRGLLAAAGCACGAALGGLADPCVRAAAANVPGAPARPIHARLDAAARAIEARMIDWRRDIHQHPELGNREVRTAGIVAAHLRRLGFDEVREGVAVTGVVGTLRGGAGPGPVVALRADMDALPVAEEVDLPFASRARTTWAGEEVGVMHACGHDCHVSVLVAAAEVLAGLRPELRGTVKLVFQPAEEGLPDFEVGGARRMLDEGAFEHPRPEAVFGLHVVPIPAGRISYVPGTSHASSDEFRITIRGRQTHAALPWAGVDPIAVGAQVFSALQMIHSREVNVVRSPSVLSVGSFRAGNRSNIIPDRAELTGTLRTFEDERREQVRRRVKEVAEGVAASMNATAEVVWAPNGVPSNANDVPLAERMAPTLARAAGPGGLALGSRVTGYEDFSHFSREVPGLFFFVGIRPPGQDARTAAPNHSPRFFVDEAGLITGLRAMLHLVADYTGSGAA